MFTIRTYDKISQTGLRQFAAEKYTVAPEAPQPDAILARSTSLHELEFNDNLKAIVRVGAGTNTIPVDRCTEAGIAVFNTPGANANAVKELVLATMIMAARNVATASHWMESLKEEENPMAVAEKGKAAYKGTEILGKRLGLIGVGAIGSRLADSCHKLGMEVLGFDPGLRHAQQMEMSSFMKFTDNVDELYATCDFISIHVPLNDKTRNYINAETIGKMKDGVILMNFVRAEIVDTPALVEALDNHKVRAYATDFPAAELLGRPEVVATPHLGASTAEAGENCAIMAAQEARDFLENGNVHNSVNLPEVVAPRESAARVTLIHENKVGLLDTITGKITAKGLNMEHLLNKAKGNVAYTMIDVNDELPADLLEELAAIDSVRRVTVF